MFGGYNRQPMAVTAVRRMSLSNMLRTRRSRLNRPTTGWLTRTSLMGRWHLKHIDDALDTVLLHTGDQSVGHRTPVLAGVLDAMSEPCALLPNSRNYPCAIRAGAESEVEATASLDRHEGPLTRRRRATVPTRTVGSHRCARNVAPRHSMTPRRPHRIAFGRVEKGAHEADVFKSLERWGTGIGVAG